MKNSREQNICRYIDYLRKNCRLKVTIHPKDPRIFHFFKPFFKYNTHESPYCIHIKSCVNAYKHCIERQDKIIKKCKEGSFCGSCYAGVFEFIYPIEFSGEIFGFISVGGYKSEKYSEYLKAVAQKYQHTYSNLLESYERLEGTIPLKSKIDTLLLPLCDMFSILIYENLNKNVQIM
ncbi:MAG: PocR ligand-binding domain-containing protein [Clostridia bacterium]|nr:PocR ligand-binding domain-containing protein [Clostridia bacterium]